MQRTLSFVFGALLAFSAMAQELKPDEVVRKVTEDVLAAVKSDKQLAAGDRQKALKLAEEKVLPVIDFEEATRLAVGRSWRDATPAYEGQTMKVQPVHMKAGETDVTVHNQYIRPGGKPVQLDYQMHKTAGGWKIYDIIVEGVSLVLTYRSEFDAVVKQQGVDGLIKRLAEKNTPAKVG